MVNGKSRSNGHIQTPSVRLYAIYSVLVHKKKPEMRCKQADQTGFDVWLLCTVHFIALKQKYKTDLTCLLIVACGALIQWHFWSHSLKVWKILQSFHCAYLGSKNTILISVKGDLERCGNWCITMWITEKWKAKELIKNTGLRKRKQEEIKEASPKM